VTVNNTVDVANTLNLNTNGGNLTVTIRRVTPCGLG